MSLRQNPGGAALPKSPQRSYDESYGRAKTRLEERTKYTGDPIDTIVILVVSVVGFIVALAWRDAIGEAFDEYFPETGSRLSAAFAYAVLSSIFAVIIILLIAKVR